MDAYCDTILLLLQHSKPERQSVSLADPPARIPEQRDHHASARRLVLLYHQWRMWKESRAKVVS